MQWQDAGPTLAVLGEPGAGMVDVPDADDRPGDERDHGGDADLQRQPPQDDFGDLHALISRRLFSARQGF